VTSDPQKTTRAADLDASNESSDLEIAVAKAEGIAYAAALKYLTTTEASDSGERKIADYLVGYAIEEAEGLYHMLGGKLEWVEPTEQNCHIEVAVRNASDGRFLPGLSIAAVLLDSEAREVDRFDLPFLWHPWIYHYGANRSVARPGRYTLRIHIAPPDFPRHDRVNGKRFEQPVQIEFEINIKTGRKLSPAA
jgi:hypothetical protein